MKKKQIIVTVSVIFISYGYAILRYNIFGEVCWTYLPLFISNKAVSFSSVCFIAISFTSRALGRFCPKLFISILDHRKYFGLLGFSLAVIHSIISLLIFRPEYYEKFFSYKGKLTLSGELSMLFGILAFFILGVMAIASLPGIKRSMIKNEWWIQIQKKCSYIGLILILLHLIMMGYESWVNPVLWPANMFPISLFAAIVVGFAIILKSYSILLKND